MNNVIWPEKGVIWCEKSSTSSSFTQVWSGKYHSLSFSILVYCRLFHIVRRDTAVKSSVVVCTPVSNGVGDDLQPSSGNYSITYYCWSTSVLLYSHIHHTGERLWQGGRKVTDMEFFKTECKLVSKVDKKCNQNWPVEPPVILTRSMARERGWCGERWTSSLHPHTSSCHPNTRHHDTSSSLSCEIHIIIRYKKEYQVNKSAFQ